MALSLETLVANLSGKVRRERRNGRSYLVAPATLLVSGVLNGSEGPIYYPPDEVEKDAMAWNHMPIVVYHPIRNGVPVSARDPEVLDKSGIGFVFRAKTETGKLQAETWFDEEDTRRVDVRILNSLEAGVPIELSTGLFLYKEDAPANSVFNGVTYKHTARNYRPDHLAVLPDQVGACGLGDGCGILVNTDRRTLWQKLGEALGLLPPATAADPALPLIFADNEGDAIEESLVTNPYPNEHACRVEDPSKFQKESFRRKEIAPGVSVVMAKRPGSDKMEVQAYRFSASKFTAEEARAWLKKHNISGRLEEATGSTNNEATVNKAQLIDFLVANCDCWKGAGDRALLEGMSEDKLKTFKEVVEKTQRTEAIANAARQGFTDQGGNQYVWNSQTNQWECRRPTPATAPAAAPVPVPAPVPAPAPASAPASAPVNNANRLTAEELEDLAFARQEKNRQRQALMDRIVANVSDQTERTRKLQVLQGKSLAQLQEIIDFMPPPAPATNSLPVPIYPGAATPSSSVPDDPNDFLPIPTFNWAEEAKRIAR